MIAIMVRDHATSSPMSVRIVPIRWRGHSESGVEAEAEAEGEGEVDHEEGREAEAHRAEVVHSGNLGNLGNLENLVMGNVEGVAFGVSVGIVDGEEGGEEWGSTRTKTADSNDTASGEMSETARPRTHRSGMWTMAMTAGREPIRDDAETTNTSNTITGNIAQRITKGITKGITEWMAITDRDRTRVRNEDAVDIVIGIATASGPRAGKLSLNPIRMVAVLRDITMTAIQCVVREGPWTDTLETPKIAKICKICKMITIR